MSICLIDQPEVRARESARCTVVGFMIGLYDVGQCILGLLFTLNSREKVFAGRCSRVITILGLLFTLKGRGLLFIREVRGYYSWLLFTREHSLFLEKTLLFPRCPLDPGILFSQVTKSCKNPKHLMLLIHMLTKWRTS